MTNLGIVTNPLEMIKQVISDVPASEVESVHEPVIRFYLYYIWRGAFEARRKYLLKQVQTDLGLLNMATYKGFIPIVQLIRLGYGGDSLILLRATIERIALLGYLGSNPSYLEQYLKGKTLYSPANEWAKNEWEKDDTTKQWLFLYGQMSKLTHSNIEGTASHVLADRNSIGRAFRKYVKPEEANETDFSEAGLIGLLFALRIADLTTARVLVDQKFKPILDDRDCLIYLSKDDWESSVKVFQQWIFEGKRNSPKGKAAA